MRRKTVGICYGLVLSLLLYFDREYYLFIGIGIGAWFIVASIRSPRTRNSVLVVGSAAFAIGVYLRARYTVAPLSSYYEKHSSGAGEFGSPTGVIIGLPRTLFAPLGGIVDSTQTVLLLFTIPIYCAYVACFYLAARRNEKDAASGRGIGFRDPRILAFVAMLVLWTLTYGGGFARGCDALAPLLFLGVARWQGHVAGSARGGAAVAQPQPARALPAH